MNEPQAITLVKETFQSGFEKQRYLRFLKNLLNEYDDEGARTNQGSRIPDKFQNYVEKLERVGKYIVDEHEVMLFIVYLKNNTSIERARTMQRNFVAWYLQDGMKDAALVAFVSNDPADWRFSFIKMEYRYDEQANKIKEEFTPAKRWSFLVGAHETSHTAQRKLVPLMADDEYNPTLAQLEEAFNIEKVTKEFFEKYRTLFIRTKEELDTTVQNDPKIKADFENKGIDTVNLAKKLLGQIVFLYYLQKKGWFGVPRDATWGEGSRNFLRELFDQKHSPYKNFFNDILEPLFYDALRIDRSHDDHYYSRFNCKIPFLNGGLFDPMNNYDWVKTDILLSNELFHNHNKTHEGDIGDGILDVFDRYNFTVKEDEPFEKEVAIDPELLGKAYEKFNAIRPDNFAEFQTALTSGKKGEESKFNKQYGVYYTPREIVHYMCQQSLINYLHSELNQAPIYQKLGDKSLDMFGNQLNTGQLDLTVEHYPTTSVSKDDIETLILRGDQIKEHDERVLAEGRETRDYSFHMPESIRNNAALIDGKLAAIKVCDPAVGSGAFPVGMMSEIVRAREVLKIWTKTPKTIYDFKRQCIENSLYGVDIDLGAVEIAKLRLWLSLIVDEDEVQNIKPLPNLDYKIVCGNSLVGFPEKGWGAGWGEGWGSDFEKEIEVLIHQHFNITNVTTKNELKTRIDEKIGSRYKNSLKAFGYAVNFDFRTVFSEVFQQHGGFDVLIANPPYVRQEEIKELKPTLQKQFECYTGTSDLFVYFFEKGVRLLRPNGILTFISSNKYFRSGYGEKLRAYLSSKTSIRQIIDFGDAPIFDAIAYPAILITQKVAPNANQFDALAWQLNEPLERFQDVLATEMFVIRQSELRIGGWQLENQLVFNLLEKLRKIGTPLGEYVKGKFYRGMVLGVNEAFVVDRNTCDALISEDESSKHLLKPFLRGRDIKRWMIESHDLYLCYVGWETNIKDYPAIYKHLKKFEIQLNARPEVKEGRMPWYALSRYASEYWQEFEKPKIMYQEIATYQAFAWDDSGSYSNNKTFLIPDASFGLLALLNSKAVWFFLNNVASKLQGNAFALQTPYISQIPVPEGITRHEIQTFVERILFAKRTNPSADTKNLEHEIDLLVYDLYGLNDEEVKIVEGL